jgi:hypothetical protein
VAETPPGQIRRPKSIDNPYPCVPQNHFVDKSSAEKGRKLSATESGSAREINSHKEERRKVMPLIQVFEVLIVVGVVLWLVNRFIPMQASIKSILNGVVVIAVVLWLLNIFGLFHSLARIRVGT